MKPYLLIAALSMMSGVSGAQCVIGSPGTNCAGPLTVQPSAGNTKQSAITLVDLGLPVPTPGVGQYTLSIASGMLVESDNGNKYHSLVGPAGAQGPPGTTGPLVLQGPEERPDPQVRRDCLVRLDLKAHRGRQEHRQHPLTITSLAGVHSVRMRDGAKSGMRSIAIRSTC